MRSCRPRSGAATARRQSRQRPNAGHGAITLPCPMPSTAAAAELRESGSLRGALRELENDPGDVLARALARLGRAFEARKAASSSGLPV